MLADELDCFPAVLEALLVHLEMTALVQGTAARKTFETCHNHLGDGHILHQKNVNRSGSKTQSSQILPATSPVLLCTSGCSQTPLELSNVLSDAATAFSGSRERTCSYGGVFRMLQDLTYMTVKFGSF